MEKVLIVFAHPYHLNSKSNKALLEEVGNNSEVTIHNLAQAYPDGKIDVAKEQELLTSFDKIILQFPTFWFNTPAILKSWFDEVFTYGWAYGPDGNALKGKKFGIVTTTGGVEDAYQKNGDKGFSIEDFLNSVIVSIKYVNADFIGYVVLHNAMNPTEEQLSVAKKEYKQLVLG
ncbi:NAD(P)H-dependent oxidoreductase [Alistipes sp. ZOR0009]|uniref:NAD(P)H-dependent oxidoreductase n=1 Tax=Alistipes sp. ZOR0009 TaxID=1339253 RepID=UPI00064837AF|nr:NAD(P)H-dependent oxidoreductase [Alistipes sp. ZOR0009]